MRYIISYDISDTKIRNRVVKYLESFCFRIQYSVFLCVTAKLSVERIIKELEMLTRSTTKKRLLVVSVSDHVKMPIWCNEDIPMHEENMLII